jgi:hypothetical protein
MHYSSDDAPKTNAFKGIILSMVIPMSGVDSAHLFLHPTIQKIDGKTSLFGIEL